jgi:Tfp pilus assembly protein PilN
MVRDRQPQRRGAVGGGVQRRQGGIVAIELNRKRIHDAIEKRSRPVHVPPHMLAGVAISAVVMTLGGLLAGIHNAGRDEAAARQSYLDAQSLAGLPPVSTEVLRTELADAKSQLAFMRALSTQSADASSGDAIARLVRAAEGSGLAVKGVTRNDVLTAKVDGTAYDVEGTRLVVEGSPGKVVAFLAALQQDASALIPSLAGLTISEAGDARAEIAFNAYAKQSPAAAGSVR